MPGKPALEVTSRAESSAGLFAFYRLGSRHLVSKHLVYGTVVCLMTVLVALPQTASGDEPAERFVEQLRGNGFFEMAIRYLDRIEEYPGVPQEFLDAIELERSKTMIAAADSSRVLAERDKYYADASTALEKFVAEKPNHPRRPEAQLSLGNLQLQRGRQLMEAGGELDEERRGTARAAFAGAAKTFDTIVQDLRTILLEMQGQKIDASAEPEKIALRDRYRRDYLVALLTGGDAMKRAGDTYASTTAEQTKWYDDALGRFTELSDKYDDTLAGILALLYAGQVQQAKGDGAQANDRYLRVLDQPDGDVLRIPKVKAVIGLMQIAMAQSPPQWQGAIDRGRPWADDIRPNERQTPEFQELRTVLADAYLGLMDASEAGADKRKAAGAVRDLLLPVSKSAGPYQAAAAERLARLGTNIPQDSTAIDLSKLPQKFSEAMELANKIVEEERSKTLMTELIKQRLADGEPLQADVDKAEQELSEIRNRGVDVLRHALTTVTADVEENEIQSARYSLAYMLYRAERFREASVVGQFVASRFPNSEHALPCAQIALGSWQLALRDAAADQVDGVMAQLQRVAQQFVDSWPNDPATAGARELLVRIAIGRNDFEAASKFLEALPADNPARSELRRAMGRLMWNRSIALQQEGDNEGAKGMRSQASAALTDGLTAISKENVSGSDLETALLLARVQMMNDDAAQALANLENPVYGPLERMNDVAVDDENFKGEVYSIALQALVAQLTADGADTETLLPRAAKVMDGLQQVYAGQSDGEKRLVGTYFRLAGDIRKQLEAAPPAKQQRLTDAFKLFLDQLATKSDDPKTLHWAAQTLLGLGQGQLGESQQRASGQTEALIKSAATLLERIANKAKAEPSWLNDPDVLRQIRLELATAARLTGQYKTAIDSLTLVLTENNVLVDAQVEAALSYEQWAASLPEKFAIASYSAAINGAKPGNNKRNILWGWGVIAQRTMGNEKFESTFFDARYHLAVCRYLQGKKTTDANQSRKLIEQSSEDIRNVLVRYPELGGKASRTKFDLLMKEIQKGLGKPSVGLAEFESATPSS